MTLSIVALIPLILMRVRFGTTFQTWRRGVTITAVLSLIYAMFALYDLQQGDTLIAGVELVAAGLGFFKVAQQVRKTRWVL